MKIVVLVKQVPAVSDIEIDSANHNLVRVGAPTMLNPVDLHAIEAAVAIKEAVGDSTVILVSMGTANAAEAMREGIAIGADKGVLVTDERMAGSDTLATSKILAKAIEKIGDVDLVLTGKQSSDSDTGQVPPAVSQHLGYALISYAESISVEGNTVKATRQNHDGMQTVEATLPAVCSIMETANSPRQPNIRGKMMAKKVVFDAWRLEDIGLDAAEAGKAGSATEVTEVFAPEPHAAGIMISGDTEEQAVKELIQVLQSEKAI